MYKDDYGNINCADNIICPYCNVEYSDSYEYFPKGDGELSWDMKCEDCGRKFHVSFDIYNQSDGFECLKICRKHKYEWDGKSIFDELGDHYISDKCNVYVCSKCGDLEFHCTKPDGTEYSKKEISDWKKEKKKKDFIKNNPECNPCDGLKEITIRCRDTEIRIGSEKPEGNEQVFKAVNRLLKSKGFDVYIPERYKKNYKGLQRWHRELNRNWLYCETEFKRNQIEYKFFQEIYRENSNGGRYDFDKYQKMDTKMKIEFRSIRKLIVDFLYRKYAVIPEKTQIHDCHGYVNNPKEINSKYPGMVIEKYSEKDFENRYGEGRDRDGNPVHNGDFMGAYDDKGRLWCGRIYNRGGTYKYMVHNTQIYSLFRTSDCFPLTGDEPRKILPKRSENVVRRLLEKAVKEENFERAAILRDRRDELNRGKE